MRVLFSAEEYIRSRYGEDEVSDERIRDLQGVVRAAQMEGEERLATALLNALTSDDAESDFNYVFFNRKIRKAFAVAAAIRGVNDQWRNDFTTYVTSLTDGTTFNVVDFYRARVLGGVNLRRVGELDKGIAYIAPTVLAYRPAFVTYPYGNGHFSGHSYGPPMLEVSYGVFHLLAPLCLVSQNDANVQAGVLQFATSRRRATYENGGGRSRWGLERADQGGQWRTR